MPNTGKANLAAILSNAVFEYQVTALDVGLDSVAEESHNAMSW
jgi:hypothetical protein